MGRCQGPSARQRLGPWVLHRLPAAAGFCALHMGYQASGEARSRARTQRHQGLIAPHVERHVQSRAEAGISLVSIAALCRREGVAAP